MTLETPYFVALDVDDQDLAWDLAQKISPYVGGFKVGPRLCIRYGPELIRKLSQLRPVFVDHKYFDIPSTTCAAVEATFWTGAQFVTVHAQVGQKALNELSQLEHRLNQIRPFKILAVTILTSFSQDSLPSNSSSLSIAEQVKVLSQDVLKSGLTGLVCSPSEVQTLRSLFPTAYLVVPGIRWTKSKGREDQVRTADPLTALRQGASALVVGRPILEALDPRLAAQELHSLLLKSLS